MATNNRPIRQGHPGLIIGAGVLLLLLLAVVAYGYLRSVAKRGRIAQRGLQGVEYLSLYQSADRPPARVPGLQAMRFASPSSRHSPDLELRKKVSVHQGR